MGRKSLGGVLLPGDATVALGAVPMQQLSRVICTSSTRPGSPFEGLKIYETDTDQEWVYTGSAWQLTSGGKCPYVVVTVASQANVVSATPTAVAFDTEVSDVNGIHSAGTFTIPTGMGGTWVFYGAANWDSNATGARYLYATINAAGEPYLAYATALAGVPQAGTITMALSAGDAVQLIVLHTAGTNRTISNGRGRLSFVGAR